MKFILGATGIVFFHNGKQVKIEKGSAAYAKIIKAFDLPKHEQDSVIKGILDGGSIGDKGLKESGFRIAGNMIFYKDEQDQEQVLPEPLTQKVFAMVKEGLPADLFKPFWLNLLQNPSCSSVRELFDFLAYKALAITEDGFFLAYRGLKNDYWSIQGNLNTRVLKGKVNAQGQIYNGVGEEIEIARWDVDDNRGKCCSHGVHVGSLDYAKNWSKGKVVVVKVNPKDVVSVPTDCNCQKCRVCHYWVIDDYDKEIVAPVVTPQGKAVVVEEKKEKSALQTRVANYLEKKRGEVIYVTQIRNAFSPEYPDEIRILDAIQDEGYVWKVDSRGAKCVYIPLLR